MVLQEVSVGFVRRYSTYCCMRNGDIEGIQSAMDVVEG